MPQISNWLNSLIPQSARTDYHSYMFNTGKFVQFFLTFLLKNIFILTWQNKSAYNEAEGPWVEEAQPFSCLKLLHSCKMWIICCLIKWDGMKNNFIDCLVVQQFIS